LGVKNLVFKEEDGNNKVEDEDKIIKDEEQVELRIIISDNLLFTVVISRR